MHDRRLDVVQNKRACITQEVRSWEFDLLTQSVEELVDLEVVMPYCSVHCEVSNGNRLIEHAPVLYMDAQPQLEPVVFRDVVPQARTEGHSQAVVELSEAGDVFLV